MSSQQHKSAKPPTPSPASQAPAPASDQAALYGNSFMQGQLAGASSGRLGRAGQAQGTDPRHKYNATEEGDPEAPKSTTVLPFRPDGSWDGRSILSKLSQIGS